MHVPPLSIFAVEADLQAQAGGPAPRQRVTRRVGALGMGKPVWSMPPNPTTLAVVGDSAAQFGRGLVLD